jgi:hypothetical protein
MHLPPVAVLAIIIAACGSFVARLFGRMTRRPRVRPSIDHPVIVTGFIVPPHRRWKDTVWHLIHQARHTQRLFFHVIVLCNDVTDVARNDADEDPVLRTRTCVHHMPSSSPTCPEYNGDVLTMRWTRKLLRCARATLSHRDDRVFVCLDAQVQVVYNWDVLICDCVAAQGADAVLTAPAASKTTHGAFPTVQSTADGCSVRGVSLTYKEALPGMIDTVCVCHEFCAGGWIAIQNVSSKTRAPANAPSVRIMAPCAPLVLSDEKVESKYVGRRVFAPPNVARLSKLGLTQTPSDEECIAKYGSAETARLAVAFEKKKKHRF